MKKLALVSLFVLFSLVNLLAQCTILTVSYGQNVLVGNNEDYGPALKKIWITPSKDSKYGTILFGFDQGYDNLEGGVNDQGLFMDAAAIRSTNWIENPKKKNLPTESFIPTILENCKDLNDVKYYVENFNHSSLKRGQFLFVDRNGQSAVLLWHENAQRLVFKENIYQVVTNFNYLTERDPYSYDVRGLIAKSMLENPDNYSIEGFKKILFATHDERGGNPTSYSTITDLKNMQIYLYNFYNFLEPFKIDINNMISQGEQTIKFSEIFSENSFMEEYHYADKLLDYLFTLILQTDVSEVIKNLEKLEKEYSVHYGLSGAHLNELGGRLLNENRIQEAIEVYAYNVIKCPDSSNAFDSLGEAYMKNGQIDEAIENYAKSLDLNPNNTNAKDMLRQLNEKMK